MSMMADTIVLIPGAGLPTLTFAEAFVMVSWWKAILYLLPLVGWAAIITRIYDKHAARFHLNRERWNILHIALGVGAFLLGFLMPLPGIAGFLVGFAAMLLVLGIDLAVYPMIANKDERVPEGHKVKIDFSAFTEKKKAKAEAKQLGSSELLIRGPDKVAIQPPNRETPEFALRLAAEQVVLRAMAARASRFELAPSGKDNAYRVIHTVDSLPVPGESIAGPEAIQIIDFWKSSAKMDIQDRRRRQMADIAIEKESDKKKIRLTATGVQGGMRLQGTFDPDLAVRRKKNEMGFLTPQAEEFDRVVGDTTGVVILATPPGQGRTTLFYTTMRGHDAYTSNVQTLELEVQDALEGVRQNVFEATKDGAEYSTTLRSILRRDPSVVGSAELPDAATAQEVIKADTERTRIYVTLKSDSALGALMTFVKATGDASAAGPLLKGVVVGKVIRKLCLNCRVAYQPPADLLKKLGLPPDKVTQLFKKGGQVLIKNKPEVCPVCNGVGYHGLEGIFEVYVLDAGVRSRIAAQDWNGVKAELRKRELPTLQQAALRKAVDGTTSIEEVMRVTAEQRPAQPAQKKPEPAPQQS
ncbi:MAG: Flp pilus assembly complex ATPase component TadA [Phycisphaeraceae bacterium]|nr:Flp pilus assembly complex ATPase component TadA [Phycisphaeraceae bacterium]